MRRSTLTADFLLLLTAAIWGFAFRAADGHGLRGALHLQRGALRAGEPVALAAAAPRARARARTRAKTATKPKFRQIDLKLKKVAALCYATDELLEDATALESWINQYVPEELRFKVEDAIMNGDGVGKPLGVLSSPALVSATRTDANEIDNDDIARMWSRRWVGVSDYVWFAAPNIMPQLLKMTIGQMPVYMPPGGLSGAQYGSLFGRPLIETEYNPRLGQVGDLLLVSPSQYALIQKELMLAQLAEKLIPFEEMLIDKPFLLGSQPHFVDFDLYGMLENFRYSGHYRLPSAHTRLRKWHSWMTRLDFKSLRREKELHS